MNSATVRTPAFLPAGMPAVRLGPGASPDTFNQTMHQRALTGLHAGLTIKKCCSPSGPVPRGFAMTPLSPQSGLEVEMVGDVAVARFTRRSFLAPEQVE